MDLKKIFGNRVKELRIKNNLTQSQLAELVEIDPKHISHIETGRSFPKADLLEKFAKIFKLDVTDLLFIGHQKDKNSIKNEIAEMVSKANDEETVIIYKFLKSLFY